MTTEQLPPVAFGEWLAQMLAVLRGERDADVPCGECVGCCVSSYPIPLRPTDAAALASVPSRHLHFPSMPGNGLALMGFREDGTCPMLCAGKCSIYSNRPQTCRDYDCRIYAAADLMPDGDRPVIAGRVRAWTFTLTSAQEQAALTAIRSAAQYIQQHRDLFPSAMRAGSATAAAVLALKVHPVFMACMNDTGLPAVTVREVIEAAQAFERGASA